MEVAEAIKSRSEDTNHQVGAVVVNSDEENLIVSTGYNGMARNIPHISDVLDSRKEKLDWICHAEENALHNAARCGISTKGCSLYVTKFPCFRCMLAMIQAGIKRVYTTDTEYWENDPVDIGAKRKKWLLRNGYLYVEAPNHDDFKLESIIGGKAA